MWKTRLCLVALVTLTLASGTVLGDAVTGLEGYWPLDDDAQDLSGNNRHGTIIGDPQFVSEGVFGGALDFDGDGDFISVDGYKGILRPPWTLAAWINTTTGGDLDIVSWGTEGGGLKVEFRLHDGRLRIEHGNGNNRGDAQIHDGEWHHGVAVLPEGGVMKDVQFYLDGAPLGVFQIGNGDNPFITTEGIDFNIGRSGPRGDRHFIGILDEIRVYSRVLSQDDIKEAMETSSAGSNPLASGPVPADGSLYQDTWVNLRWKPGAFAVSHDVYMGDNLDDVNNATRESELFRGNQAADFYVAGFPGFAFPEGLVPGTTYYWRIDEVNDAHPDSPWKGDLWCFTVPPRIAYDPIPAGGAEFVDTDTTLSWKAGMNTKLHYVYFGADFDQVSNAAGALPQAGTTYEPGELELDKTYYWRVDEFDGAATHRGDVWSFTTLPAIAITDPNLLAWFKLDEIGGATAMDWSGHDSHGLFRGTAQWIVPGLIGEAALTFGQNGYVAIQNLHYDRAGRTESTVCGWVRTTNPGTQIIASFGRVDYWRVGIDHFGAGAGLIDWDVATNNGQVDHGSVTRVDDGLWHHVCCVFDRGLMSIYIDGREDSTMSGGATFGTGQVRYGFLGADSLATTFDGARDRFASLVGDIDDFRIYDKALTPDEIIQAMRGDPLVAWNPNPANGSTPDIDAALPLSWSPGDNASQHDVYFGTDRDAADNADASDATGIYRGRQNATTYTPPEGVEWGSGPYYWRIDEVNTDGTITKGNIWGFTVADFILVDDFESYDVGTNELWWSWKDGLGYGAHGNEPAYPGNGTGAAVGDETTSSYTEETIVHSGNQSMPFAYDNNKQGYAYYSEAELTLTAPRDWTRHDLGELAIWFHGLPASVGTFVEGPVGTFRMTASGTDITGLADEFHYAYKMLTGPGSIIARVDSVQNTNAWAKAGVMIRETLNPGSAHAMAFVTPGQGVAFEYRLDEGQNNVGAAGRQTGITAPHWVKLERNASGNFAAWHSANGSAWEQIQTAFPVNITMTSNVYIGLALTAHNANAVCEAKFSNVGMTGTVGPQWSNEDIGIASNDAEPLYVAVSNRVGQPAVVVHDDPAAATINAWTEWVIPLSALSDQGINLANVDSLAIGLGTRGNQTAPGGSGKMYFDDIRLYQPRTAP